MCVNGELIGTHGRAIERAYPRPARPPYPQNREVEKSSFEIAAKRVEVDENVSRARHFLALNLCLPKRVNADRTQHTRSSSGLITIVVMTLY